MILELTGQIPLRTPFEDLPSDATPESRTEMWKKLRQGFKNHDVILKMYEEFDTTRLTDNHFMLLNRLEVDHQVDIDRAIELNSLAVPIYKLAVAHRDMYNHQKAFRAQAPRYPDLCDSLVRARSRKQFLDFIYSGATNPWLK